jgi:hypothetical protein
VNLTIDEIFGCNFCFFVLIQYLDFVLEAIHLAMKEEGNGNNNSCVNVAINNKQSLKKTRSSSCFLIMMTKVQRLVVRF